MNNNTQKYLGIAAVCRHATIKKSRGKEYPSIDVRNTDIEKILQTARTHSLCSVFIYTIKSRTFMLKIEPEFSQRTTVSCRYGIPFTENNAKKLIGHELD